MKKLLPLLSILMLLNGFQAIKASSDEKIKTFDRTTNYVYFKTESILPERIDASLIGTINISKEEILNNGVIRVLQFDVLPNEAQKQSIASAGIQLLDYMPNRAFISFVPLNTNFETLYKLGIRGIHNFEGNLKTDKFISDNNYPDYVVEGNNRRVLVIAFPFINFSSVVTSLSQDFEAQILGANEELSQIEILLPHTKVQSLSTLKTLKYIEIGSEEGKPENSTARTLHRSNTLNTNYPGGKKYDGTGVVVMMQDDGDIGPHIDFNGRVDQSQANVNTSSGNHGDHVAGTFMGSGNLDPLAEGMAPGVFGFIHGNSNDHYNQVPGRYNNDNLVITTKSYSNGCNAGYTGLTNQLDQQVNDFPHLLHVFSAGNSNGSNCGYGAGTQWGNITGGHKIGKNVVTVANLNLTDQISGSSSRGPASDGRIKPDISSKGTNVFSNDENYGYRTISGTSMACPGVTGTIAQLYHAYRDLNGGNDPNSALMKAVVLNSADDIGNPGPDFIHGWGRINALNAFTVLENQQYMNDSINNTDSSTHSLTIPANVAQVKIMLYWKDPAGTTNAQQHLVNDLDMNVTTPSSSVELPLILDPTPNSTSLNFPAVPGIDMLNNMEQVVIDAPAAGTYQIKVKGSSVPQGPQEYFIVYSFIYDIVTLTYPIGGEPIAPSETQVIRWDAYGNSGNFSLEYSLDSGSTWVPISGGISGSQRYFNWNVPNVSTKNGLIRVTRGSSVDASDATFTILGIPNNITVITSCTDSARLQWSAVNGADGYIVRKLGAQYMDSVEFTTSTSTYVDNINFNDPDVWLTVQAVILNSSGQVIGKGRRANAKRKAIGIYNCPTVLPVAQFSANSELVCVDGTVIFTNETVNANGNFTWTVTPSSHTFVNGTNLNSENPEIQFNSNSDYTIKLEAANLAGVSTEEKVDFIKTFNANSTLNETFEFAIFPPFSWSIEQSNGSITWTSFSLNVGADGNPTKASYFNRFSDNSIGELDALVTRPIDLSGYLNPVLVFDVAYAAQSNLPPSVAGGLKIDYSNDCGSNFQASSYYKPGNDLMTTSLQTSLWQPASASEWRSDSLNLSALASSGVVLKFVNISGITSNSLFIDNVRIIDHITGLKDESEISLNIFPNPSNGNINIQSSNFGKGEYNISVYDLNGRLIQKTNGVNTSQKLDVNINVNNVEDGLYLIKAKGINTSIQKRISIFNAND